LAKSIHELRFKDRSGIFRVIYFLAGIQGIYFIHAFSKKTQQTSLKDIEIAKKRLKGI
jgi:predicted XRE-type DNA-binding protein